MTTYYESVESPVGTILLISDGEALTGLFMNEHKHGDVVGADWKQESVPVLAETKRQLAEYFAGDRREFDIPIRFGRGTEFQQKVWQELRKIPFGSTISYGELARRVGDANASRAVGLANGRNPVSILVPCHRVVGANGKLTGYGGGMERKSFLLTLESGLGL